MNARLLNKRAMRMTCFIGSILLALWMQGAGFWANSAQAETAVPVQIESQVGFGATNVKQGRWTPVTLTLTNQGADVAGDVVVQIANPNRSKDFTYVQHVELPRGSTKAVTMLLPGYAYTKSNNTIAFYEKSQNNGKKIPLEGRTYLEAFNLPKETMQVGVLARDVDTLNFLTLLNQSGVKVNVLHLKQPDIPKASLGLDGIDVLVLNDFASDTLASEQVQAIRQWTRTGGTLLLSGGAGYTKTSGPFAEASPITYEGTTSVTKLTELEKAGEKELVLAQPFTLSSGKPVKGAETVYAEGEIPVVARAPYGNGFVVYAAYDLSLNPLASWNGNQRLWEKVLQGPIQSANALSTNQMKFGNNAFWEMDRALDYFPSIQPPKLPMLALVLLLYALIAAPVLYIVLARLDRREWAWFIIPVIALVTSVGIFQFGATNRGSMMGQTLSAVTLNGSGGGAKTTWMSIFLPKGGDLELKLAGKPAISPLLQSDIYPGLLLHEGSEMAIRQEPEAAVVRLQDIPYSSISKLLMKEDQLPSFGKLDYRITELTAQSAKGQIINNTAKELTDVAVIMNQTYIQVGSIPPGGSASFDTNIGIGNMNGPDIAQIAFPYGANNGVDAGLQQRAMLATYLNEKVNFSGSFTPMIIGWAKEQSGISLASSGTIPTDQLTLVAQEMKIDYVTPEGKIMIPSSAIVPNLTENHMKMSAVQFQNGPFMQLGSGDLTLEYPLPAIAGAAYQTMTLSGDPNPDVTTELWNANTQAWEPVTLKSIQTWEGAALQPYLTAGHSIRLKVTTMQNNTMFRIPAISLEGAVRR
ncbi:hypothetical protein ACFPES_16510 [Paenibacillus sp. GCM10023248]|uniref:DUF7408 domain-containing protein n=1 Tax=unclassified Paenibacillus TaxID=185978 RepID=UPI002379AF4D|nr:hypothetical protein [Paenibacillus sp. MAHUQ-63]MDD9268643.1 hypothetical protein [Paenibacillus sp. MAHUQ-63]